MKSQLPRSIKWLISLMATGRDKEIIEGDFEEALAEAKPRSLHYYRLVMKELLGMMRITHLRRKQRQQPSGLGANLLKVIIRNLRRKWNYTVINVSGLSISLMVFGLILAYVTHELGYDRYHKDHERIFRITYQENADEPVDGHWARVPLDWINKLPDYFPQVEQYVRFQSFRFRDIQVGEQAFREHYAFSVDPDVFDVLDLPFVHGDAQSALRHPNSVVLTETIARKYFGTNEVLGETLKTVSNSGDFETYQVTGVIKDIPDNSHLPINLLTTINTQEERTGWAYIYVKLSAEKDARVITEDMPSFIETHAPDPETTSMFNLQPISDIHLNSHLSREIATNNQLSNILIFLGASVFLLLVAIINYANLNSVQSLNRSRELGIRKVLGGSKTHLRQYFFLESFLLFVLSLVLAGIGYVTLLKYLGAFLGQTLQPDTSLLLAVTLSLMIVVPWISSLYPTQALVKLSIIQALKSQLAINSKLPRRKILIGLQFGLAMALISAMHITTQQFHFLLNKNLGFEREQLVAIRHIPDAVKQNMDVIREELVRLPSINAVSAVMELPGSAVRDGIILLKPGQEVEDGIPVDIQIVEPNFPELMKMEFVAGKALRQVSYPAFPPGSSVQEIFSTISDRQRSYVLNEAAVRLLGWDNPSEALGKTISGFNPFYQLSEGQIVGIVKDYHQESLRAAIDPVIMVYEPIWLNHLLVKLNSGDLFETVEQMEALWQTKYAAYPMDMVFLDQEMNNLYESERQQKELLKIFTAITLVIAILGLLGLMGYALKIRQKEMAVRKVLGADLVALIQLLAKEYLWSLVIGMALAVPLVWMSMEQWLQNYAYHTEIGVSSFAIGAIILALLILVPLITQVIRNDRNPAEVLKSE
ncbi:MAG: ABC transporter permease [Cytophagales bacterium]|nr:ABC transporter permease [Cytophagales bacterium]